MRWSVLYVLQLFSPYMTSSFAKIPTLHGLCNQNVCRFSHAPEAVTIPDSHSSTSDSLFERPPEVNTTEFKLRLGSFKIDPFESGKLDGSQIYAAHVLQSESDAAFGGAFLSLRKRTGDNNSEQSWKLGIPSGQRFIALHRFKLWWMLPCHFKNPSGIPAETQLLVGELPPDLNTGKRFYSVFIPLLDGPAKASLRGLEDGYLQVSAETGCNHVPVPSDVEALFVAIHDDVHELIFKAFRIVKSHIALQVKRPEIISGQLLRKVENTIFQLTRREVIRYEPEVFIPDFCKSLGWCTWDSFYTTVNGKKVLEGLEAFTLAGLKPRWVILDDGWQSTTNEKALNGEQWFSSLTSFKANSKFDLEHTIRLAKENFNIKHFFCWHALVGYWFGLDLDSQELRKYGPRRAIFQYPPGILETDQDLKFIKYLSRIVPRRFSDFFMRHFGVVPANNILAFYNDYHKYLKAQGVDGVKVDAQSVVNCVGRGHGGSVALARAYHKALSKSIATNFPDKILLQLPACYTPYRATIRGSADFYPQDTASHGPHLYANAFNGLMIARCGLQDWDMFQTNLGVSSEIHAAAHAISGGPVYISDRPDKCNRVILSKLVLDDGSVPITAGNALPIARTMFSDPQSDPNTLLIIWNKNPVNGHGVLGAFNIYGSSWNPTKQAYATIPGNTEFSQRVIKGSLFPIDCYCLVKELELEKEEKEDEQKKRQVKIATTTTKKWTGGGGYKKLCGQRNFCEYSRKRGNNNVFKEELFAMYFMKARKLTVQRLHEAETLDVLNFEVAAVSRVHSLQLARSRSRGGGYEDNNLQWASIGLINLYNAGGAIVEESFVFTAENGKIQQFVDVTVIGRGQFVAYCSKRPMHVYLDGNEVEWSWNKNASKLNQSEGYNTNVLEEGTKKNGDDPIPFCDGGDDDASIPQQQLYQGGVIHHESPMLEVNISQPYMGLPRRLQCHWN